MLSAKKARQRTLIVSGGDRILSDIEKLLIFTIVKMRFGCLRSEVKYQPKVDQCSLGAHSVPKDGGSSPAFTIIPFSRQLHQSNNKSIEIESHYAASESNNISRSSCYTPSSTPAPLHARTPCLHLHTRPRLTSGLRRQQGQREVYINSPAPTHTSLATLNNFLLSANN